MPCARLVTGCGHQIAQPHLARTQEQQPESSRRARAAVAMAAALALPIRQQIIDWLDAKGLDVAAIHAHAQVLQAIFAEGLARRPCGVLALENLVVPLDGPARGNVLTFRHAGAALWHEKLKQAGITVDLRGDRLRVGFGLYQTEADVKLLLERMLTLR